MKDREDNARAKREECSIGSRLYGALRSDPVASVKAWAEPLLISHVNVDETRWKLTR